MVLLQSQVALRLQVVPRPLSRLERQRQCPVGPQCRRGRGSAGFLPLVHHAHQEEVVDLGIRDRLGRLDVGLFPGHRALGGVGDFPARLQAADHQSRSIAAQRRQLRWIELRHRLGEPEFARIEDRLRDRLLQPLG